MCKLMEDFLKEYSAPMIKEAEIRAEARGEARGEAQGELRGKIDAIRSMIINGLVTLNDLKASGHYTDEELAAISQ